MECGRQAEGTGVRVLACWPPTDVAPNALQQTDSGEAEVEYTEGPSVLSSFVNSSLPLPLLLLLTLSCPPVVESLTTFGSSYLSL